jgi:hypothetical protein
MQWFDLNQSLFCRWGEATDATTAKPSIGVLVGVGVGGSIDEVHPASSQKSTGRTNIHFCRLRIGDCPLDRKR